MKKNQTKQAFTLIELLVVIAIIGLLATAAIISFSSTREGSRDAVRLSDINQIQSALDLYWHASGVYPLEHEVQKGQSIEYNNIVFLDSVPEPPTPSNDGDCPELEGENLVYDYTIIGTGGNMSYQLKFCLGTVNNHLDPGEYIATPQGIIPFVE